MNKPTFEINESGGTIELKAFGELTANNENTFRWTLIRLLQYGKSKSYKLNLTQATAMDISGIQLIYIFKRELTAVDAALVVEMPEEPAVKSFLIRIGFLERLS